MFINLLFNERFYFTILIYLKSQSSLKYIKSFQLNNFCYCIILFLFFFFFLINEAKLILIIANLQ